MILPPIVNELNHMLQFAYIHDSNTCVQDCLRRLCGHAMQRPVSMLCAMHLQGRCT